jgi:hypothetical protein
MGLMDILFGKKNNAKGDTNKSSFPKQAINQSKAPLPPGDVGEFMEIARRAWRSGDFDRARLMYQKSSYAASNIGDAKIKDQVNTMIKSEQAKYVIEDPVFNIIVERALEVIRSSPGIMQSKIYEQIPYDRELTQWVLYYADVIGRIRREKKGRSYMLSVGSI